MPAPLPSVAGLRADIVPHSRWAVSKWFYANPIWYYHRRGTDEELVADRKFYALVDPLLRPLCKLLHDHGLHTTPSCEGHFYPRERFERIWETLAREADEVRGAGLVVKDSETGKPYLFRQRDYRLPWGSFDAFYAEAGSHQGTGYLGILLPCDCGEIVERLRTAEQVRPDLVMAFDEANGPLLGGRLFGITVRPRDLAHRERLWTQITARFARVLERHACPTAFVPIARREAQRSH